MKNHLYKLFFCLLVTLLASCAQKQYVHVGANWDAVHNLQKSEREFGVEVRGPEKAMVGDALEFTVISEKTGNLWMVKVDPNDELALLYPNDFSGSNRVEAGEEIVIPGEDAGYAINASTPKGLSTVAFIVTDPETDLNDVFNGKHASMNKALSIVKLAPSWGITHVVVDVM
jgi:hypothetical protein